MKSLYLTSSLLFLVLASAAQTTYYVETTGSNSNPGTSALPYATIQGVINNETLVPGDSILVGAGTWTDEPITFTAADDGDATGFVTLQGQDSASTIMEYFLGVTNSIHLDGANYVKVRNIKFDDASDDVVQISGGDNNVIEHCWVLDGADEISIEASGSNTADNNIIRNNLLESDAFTYVDINGNNSGGTHICVGNQINDNVMRLMSGGAATPGIELSFADETIIQSNRILGGTRGIEIRNTGGADNIEVYNNYIRTNDDGFYNNGSTANSGNGKLYNNSFYSGATCAHFRSISGATVGGWDIRNNIFYTTSTSSSQYCLRIDGSTTAAICDYNQYYHPGGARCGNFNGTAYADLTGTGSADWDEIDHSSEAGMLGDESSQQGDPLYNNPASTANDGLNLTASSPCFGVGVTLVGVTQDINDLTRPASPALGAYEDAAILPIELLLFDASAQQRTALLQWKTASELNNHFFTLERSLDGHAWEEIGEVLGAGNSTTTLAYDFVDDNPYYPLSYYRLKQTDFDGASAYSAMRAVYFTEPEVSFGLYPNPSEGMVNIQLSLEDDAPLYYEVFGIDGKLTERSLVENKSISLNHLPAGLYTLALYEQNGTVIGHQKIVLK